MRKIYTITIAMLAMFVVNIQSVFAQNINYQIPNPSRYESLEDIINAGASLIRPVFLLTFGGMILFGAFMLLTSQGEEEKVENAKKTIGAAVVGFIIAALAPTLVNLLLNFLDINGLDS